MTKDGHLVWVSTKVTDVELDPVEGSDQVIEGVVAAGGRLLRVGEGVV